MQLFLYFAFLAPFRIRGTIFAEFPVESQSKKKKVCSCSCVVTALQTFVSHNVPIVCPTPATVTRRIMFTWFLIAQILLGQKFQTCSEGISGSMDRVPIFFLLIWWYKCCFSLVFIVMHADKSSVWLKSPKAPRRFWPSSEMCFMISASAWTATKTGF